MKAGRFAVRPLSCLDIDQTVRYSNCMNIAKAIVFSGVIALSASGLAACSSTPDCQSLATQSGFELASAITPEKAGGGGGGGGSKGGGTSSGSKGGSTVPKSGTNSQPKTNTT